MTFVRVQGIVLPVLGLSDGRFTQVERKVRTPANSVRVSERPLKLLKKLLTTTGYKVRYSGAGIPLLSVRIKA